MRILKKLNRAKTPIITVFLGVFLAISVFAGVGVFAFNSAENIAYDNLKLIINQTESFDEIKASDRMNEFFAINENLIFMSNTLELKPELVNDEYLEDFVDSMKITGIAVLDENLKLEASGYTRAYTQIDWRNDFYDGFFEDILNTPELVYSQRLDIDGQYYDVCAVSRKDKKGVIIAYYKHSMNRIYETDENLKRLLDSVPMTLDGGFIITKGDSIISDNATMSNKEDFISNTANLSFGELKNFENGGKDYFGMRAIKGDYKIYLYFPQYSVLSNAYVVTVYFVLIYIVCALLVVAYRSRTSRRRQEILERTNKQLNESLGVLKSLEGIYFTVFYVDLKADTYKSFAIAPWLNAIIPESGPFIESMNKLIDACVLEKYKKRIKKSLGYDYVSRELHSRKISESRRSFYYDYQAVRGEEIVWCRVTVTSVDFDSEGNPHHALMMLQDVNYEKEKEENYKARILRESELAQAASRAKSAFLFNISHDIRTPMTAILGYSDLAIESLEDKEKTAHYIENIHTSSEALLSLTDELLQFARIENGKVEIEESVERTESILDACKVMILPHAKNKGIELEFEKDIIYPYISIDHKHAMRIILNLLNNAVKFTESGGKIICKLYQEKTHDEREAILHIDVSDTGIGISEEFLPHIFEMFERGKDVSNRGIQGTGLGLGIVKKLTELMNGSVHVESKLDVGTTFYVKLPCKVACENDMSGSEIKYSLDQKEIRNKRILIADDSDLNCEILSEILKHEGLESDTVRDGKECIEKLKNKPQFYYSMVLMDIRMPKLDGYEATKIIRQADGYIKNIPIVAMSANAYPEDIERSLSCGMNYHLSKPIINNKLMLVLSEYLGVDLTLK